ncbi:alpha- and gamma-adaptin-binding protein p34-like [Saccoglossus kowalevskii]|uniref:Alpha- and gamma-adaptin-binding protein p34-like n=1 Tax=Saccoglossus kowalevskii TaxID=10224 RepID=A0ABM0LTY1_SACKO|nr:PREDICTED: alpha- and gamma-adaptin-binding protein p34-like [Saccoglossus kowalevskii]
MAASAVIASCCSVVDPRNLIKDILGLSSLPSYQTRIENIEAYPWTISNKYYTADVELCYPPRKTLGNEEFADSVQAVVIAFENKQGSFDEVKTWLPFVEAWNPEVRILACHQFQDQGISRHDILLWCIDNEFELVELNTEREEDDDDEEYDICGLKRIISALHAHTWPNLVMKDRPGLGPLDLLSFGGSPLSHRAPLPDNSEEAEEIPACGEKAETETQERANKTDDADPEEVVTSKNKNLEKNKPESNLHDSEQNEHDNDTSEKMEKADCEPMEKVKPDDSSASNVSQGARKKEKQASHTEMIDDLLGDDERRLYEALGSEDPGDTSFEQMFSQFLKMKETAETLPPDEKKAYAEKVTIAFWKAVGGADEEIEGLSSDSDDS